MLASACGTEDRILGTVTPPTITTTTVETPAEAPISAAPAEAVDDAPLRPPVPDLPRSDGRFSTVLGEDRPAEPTAVRIGGLTIEAPVVPVGVEPDGLMEIPGADEVGWYRFGSTAGQAGSTVLAAHVDYNGSRGVFFELGDLEVGAEVEVELSDGSVRRYEVFEATSYSKEVLPLDDVFRRSGSEVLTLITCGGAFDASAQAYEDNLVVLAAPIT